MSEATPLRHQVFAWFSWHDANAKATGCLTDVRIFDHAGIDAQIQRADSCFKEFGLQPQRLNSTFLLAQTSGPAQEICTTLKKRFVDLKIPFEAGFGTVGG